MRFSPGLVKKFFVILAFILPVIKSNAQYQWSKNEITVLKTPADQMMKDYLTQIVDKQFQKRDSLLSTLKSAEDWDLRSQVIRDSIISWTGPFPDRTPLNARITGVLDRKDYIIEKIIFESRPGFFVSGNLYLPKNIPNPKPAILNIVGHGDVGKAVDKTQQICIGQVKKGFVSLVIDGLGQGERQIYDVRVGLSHQIIGRQAFISGTHVFNFMVWDAIRAIDYLVSRAEVDAENIGITGSSGGGMMSTYILPFEDRIAVSVPVCNPNTWSYRVRTGLGTDHEQVFFGAFESAIDPRGDPLFANVPRPLLINATADDDLNPPRGVWDLSTWLNKSYSAHGAPEKFTTTMVKASHDYNQEQREISYAWMLRWLGGNSKDFQEESANPEKEEDLWATKDGSVYDEPGSREPHEWVLDYLSKHKFEPEIIKSQKALGKHKVGMVKSIRHVLNTKFDNIKVVGDLEESRSIDDITIQPFILKPEPGIVLPGIMLKSNVIDSNKDVILYISQNGKSDILNDMDMAEKMLEAGYRICAMDLRGTGETSPDLENKFWDFLAGKPIFGQRVRDILATVSWLKESEIGAQNIKFWGTGMAALYGAFAGVMSEDISAFVFDEPLLSFESVVQVKMPTYMNEVMLPGILEEFDMPQVYQALCPRKTTILNPYSGDKTLADISDIDKMDKLVATTFRGLKKQKNWHITKVPEQEREKIIVNALLDN